ncbi:MAG: aldo/keto reductase, partial [Candidatus Latescibacterota bacterium]
MPDQNKLSRRDFIAQTAALGAGALLTIGAPGMGYGARTVPTVKLGKTGQIIPKLSFGTAFNLTPQLVRIALNEGLNYLDTAEGYNNGNSERSIGDMLSKLTNRKDCFIVSKTGRHDPSGLPDKLQGSLERLQTDYVDSYYLHNLGNPDLLNADMKSAAEKLKKEGKIRFFGFSSHHRNMIQTLEKAAEVGFVDMVMFKYNFWDYDNDALNKAIDKCAKANIGLIAMKTQGGAATVPDKVDQFKAKGFNPFQAALKAVWA